MKWFGRTQFALFRIILGCYLTIHFYELIPYGEQMFSNRGMIKDVTLLLTYGKIPNVLFYFDSPLQIKIFLVGLVFASVLFTLGLWRRRCSAVLYYGWICLVNRNHFISNPGLAYVGWLLLMFGLIPYGDRLGVVLTEEQRKEEKNLANLRGNRRWEVTDGIYFGAWIVMAVSYTASGFHKLQFSPSWLDGTALHSVLTGPLAREYNPINYVLLHVMPGCVLKMMTWVSLFGECSFLFLGGFFHLRKWYWLFFIGFHLGILATVNFSDLTIGMMMIHIFTFDASWFEWSRNFVRKYDMETDYDVAEARKRVSFASDTKKSEERAKKGKDVGKEASKETGKETGKDNETTKKDGGAWGRCEIMNAIVAIVAIIGGVQLLEYEYGGKGLVENISRIGELTVDMSWGFAFIIGVMALLMVLERVFPDQKLEYVPGWWKWIMIINVFQLFAVVLATFTWEKWLQETSYFTSATGFHLRDHVGPFWGGVIAYVLNQWLFYWWHLARHVVYFLWLLFHQFHHSAQRIETATSFYKHPLEIIADSQIMAIMYLHVLGLGPKSGMWLSIFSAIGEYFYHMNIKTPQWIGYFFQRPEAHRVHHFRNKREHSFNYSDFSVWDMLGGTWCNPNRMDGPTGFSRKSELQRVEMLCFKDVLFPSKEKMTWKRWKKIWRMGATYVLVVWGTFSSVAFLAHADKMQGMGFATVASPLPLVFSGSGGEETFTTKFELNATLVDGREFGMVFDNHLYSKLEGPYMRKNIIGVMFSHGPFFKDAKMLTMRDQVLHYCVCDPGPLIRELGVPSNVTKLAITVRSKSDPVNRKWLMHVDCTRPAPSFSLNALK